MDGIGVSVRAAGATASLIMIKTRTVLVPIVEGGVVLGEVPVELSEQCATCRHWTANLQCEAFPDLIPADIRAGRFDHTDPHEGDGGVRYEPIDRLHPEGRG